MIGAIAGDVIGSSYEFHPIKSVEFTLFNRFSRFTDDTVCTIALADAILTGGDYTKILRSYCMEYPDAGYGGRFWQWLNSDAAAPYNSFGNGSAMRVSPVGFACTTETEVLEQARRSAVITHNHPEGVKGAQATALAIFLAARGADKQSIKTEIASRFNYDLDRKIEDIRPDYQFDETCQGSVAEAILAFLESNSYENCIRLAVSLGGDADTQACIAGGIAQAFYREVPSFIEQETLTRLTPHMRETISAFRNRYGW
ncbi:MAG: ADP-ribosylglycohydrolase family protein [Leptolinea sp.]|jgi:ADP-ribosylglycohydrolase|nr:ADP-ribosylglycohydrolase family protein [Leptolinea sp.]